MPGVIVVLLYYWAKRYLPDSPEEDQVILINLNLPDAASLERTDSVMVRIEKMLQKEEGGILYRDIGFRMLTNTYNSNMGFSLFRLRNGENGVRKLPNSLYAN
jgi:multidrug efflux pump subunit AcrB